MPYILQMKQQTKTLCIDQKHTRSVFLEQKSNDQRHVNRCRLQRCDCLTLHFILISIAVSTVQAYCISKLLDCFVILHKYLFSSYTSYCNNSRFQIYQITVEYHKSLIPLVAIVSHRIREIIRSDSESKQCAGGQRSDCHIAVYLHHQRSTQQPEHHLDGDTSLQCQSTRTGTAHSSILCDRLI